MLSIVVPWTWSRAIALIGFFSVPSMTNSKQIASHYVFNGNLLIKGLLFINMYFKFNDEREIHLDL